MFGAAAGSATEGEVPPGALSNETGLSLIKLRVPGSSELCSSSHSAGAGAGFDKFRSG